MKLLNLKALGFACAVLGCAFSAARADIIEVSSNIASDTRWTRDNVYVVTQIVYILPPAKLTVEPGTVIRAAKSTLTGRTNNPGSLIVTRGAKIIGNGTVDDPIIFTCLDDPYVPGGVNTIPSTITGFSGSVDVPQQDFSLTGPNGLNAFAYSKECGGLVLLGRSPIGYDNNNNDLYLQWNGVTHSVDSIAYPTDFATSTGNGVGIALIEGLTSTTVTLATAFDADGAGSVFAPSTTFNLGYFGGVDENDDSGVIRFWSHRYGGFNISDGNEINGVTMGGVGRGTVLEFQEVVQNADDGYEWFGGYVGARYLASVVNGDDAFDGDFGFSGNLQHLFAMNDNESYLRSGFGGDSEGVAVGRNAKAVSDKMFEWDGAEPDRNIVTPQTNAFIYNYTLIGNKGAPVIPANSDSAINVLKGADGLFAYGVAEDIGGGNSGAGPLILIGDAAGTPVDTRVDFNRLLYFNVGTVVSGNDADNVLTNVTDAVSTQLRGKGHLIKNGLDPRLVNDAAPNSSARDLTLPLPARDGVTGFFSPIRYHGAMRDSNWLYGWTWLHQVEMMATTNVDRPRVSLSVNAGDVSVSFAADMDETSAGDAVLYVIERSTDGRVWSPIGSVQDGSAEDSGNQVFVDTNASAGQITLVDADYDYTGSPVHYRVIPQ